MSLNMFNKIHELSQTHPMEFNTIDGYRTPLPWKRNGHVISRSLSSLGLWTNQVIFLQGSFEENIGPFFTDWPFYPDIFVNKKVQFKGKFQREILKDHFVNYRPGGQNPLNPPIFIDTLEVVFWPYKNNPNEDLSVGTDSAGYDRAFNFFSSGYSSLNDASNPQSLVKNYFRWKRNSVANNNNSHHGYDAEVCRWNLDSDSHNKVITGFPYHGVNTNIIVLESQLGSKFHIRQWESRHSLRVRGQFISSDSDTYINNTYSEAGIIEFSSYSTINGTFNIDPLTYTGRTLKWTDPDFKLEAGKHFRIILDFSYPKLLTVTGISA